MKKNVFTLIELLVVIGILAGLMLIIIPKFSNILNTNRDKGYKEIEKRLEEAALKYATDNYIEGNKITIEKKLLVSSSLIGEVYDLENKNAVCDGYVVIDIVNNTAKSYIKCENYQTEGYVG